MIKEARRTVEVYVYITCQFLDLYSREQSLSPACPHLCQRHSPNSALVHSTGAVRNVHDVWNIVSGRHTSVPVCVCLT